ncbi:MAG: protein kinase domain-containing protein [Anaerolineae bacterium]
MLEQLVGQSLDRYQLVELLGEGGMGAVFRGRDITLQRDVAIKVMQPQAARLPNFQERFLNEARTAARLDHPGIVKVFDFGQASGYLYIVMELLRGDNLRKLLDGLQRSGKTLSLMEAVQIVRQVCLALDYAHQQGVLHRDIKPDNIMLKPEPVEGLAFRPVLTDLGLAKLLEGIHLTVDGTSMGTPAYMSPEQALGEKTDARSDVYSVGILLYELLAGRLPFPIRTLTEAIRYHTKEPPPTLRSIRPDVPDALERAVMTAIAKSPAERFPSAGAMAQALVQALPFAGPTATLAATPTMAGDTGLLTLYQESAGRQRGASILAEFPQSPLQAGQDRITILLPDGQVRAINMPGPEITIGRDVSNQVQLEMGNVSRQHARIAFDGKDYKVTDLNSTNGTFLGNVKLLPGVPEVWTPDKALRIGDCWLRLERAAAGGVAPSMAMAGGTMVGGAARSAPVQRVAAFLDVSDLVVEAGGSVSVPVTILNQGPVVDHFQITVVNLPAAWVPTLPPMTRLLPGAQQVVSITITPPRSPQSRAGVYPFTVRVASQDAPDQVAELPARLTVRPYAQFSAELRPQSTRAGRRAQVLVNNQGNAPQTYEVSWHDRADELTFNPPAAQLTVPEGRVGALDYRAKPRRFRLFGGTLTHPFTTRIAPPAGEPISANGEVTSRGLIPSWLPPLILLPLIALCVAAVLFIMRKPVIRSVTITPTNPVAGEPFTVSWEVENAQTIELRPLVRGLDASLGGYRFERGLQAATSFTLVAQNRFGTAEQTVQIAIVAAPLPTPTPTATPEPGAPVVEEFSVVPNAVTAGDPVTIRWRVTNAESVTLQPFGEVALSGEVQDLPATSTQYVLTAVNEGKMVERSFAVTVSQPQAPTIVKFTADPASLEAGSVATIHLSWQVQGAESVTIQPGIGNVGASGEMDIPAPASTTQYTLVATNAAGPVQQQLEVQVQPVLGPPPVLPTDTPVPQPTWTLPISIRGNRVEYNLRLTGPGLIRFRLTWSGSQGNLALIINGPGQVGYYARQDGGTPLEVSYNVTEADFKKGDAWKVSVVSFGNGIASGTVQIWYPSGSSVSPYQAGLQLSPDDALSCTLVVTKRLIMTSDYSVQARATWSGPASNTSLTVASRANPAIWAEKSGNSPLEVRRDVSGSDASVGDTWLIWFKGSGASSAEGTLELFYPYASLWIIKPIDLVPIVPGS